MKRLLAVLLVVVACFGGLWWVLAHATGLRGRTAHTSIPGPAAAPSPPPLPRAGAEAPAAPPPSAGASVARLPPTERREAASGKSDELARATWVEGRVLFPEGTPLDEEAFVIAEGRDFADGTDHRAAVARDGSFRVAFHEKARTGRLALEARYLYLDSIVRWKRDGPDTRFALEPRLGARLAGRVVVPDRATPARVEGRLELALVKGRFDTEDVAGRPVGPELTFAFDAVRMGAAREATAELAYEGPAWIGELGDIPLRAGETRTVDLRLRPGVVLAGVVRDHLGAPIRQAMVFAQTQSSSSAGSMRHAISGSDGSFRLPALEPGKIEVEVRHEGFEKLERDLGALAAGTERSDLELVLTSGFAITGSVRWPDGSPAKAFLTLVPEQKGLARIAPEMQGRSDSDGTFTVEGLAETTYRVWARALRPAAGASTTLVSEVVDGVPAGTRGLVLTLAPSLVLAGRVEDELGAPLDEFRIVARRVEGNRVWFGEGELSRSFRGADGAFWIDGFGEGEWDLTVERDEGLTSRPVRVAAPARESLLLVAPRAATVQGRVLDHKGAPVSGALVAADEVRSDGNFSVGADPETTTDELGRFELRGLAGGANSFQATAAGFAPSEKRTLELAPGTTHDGLELVLRLGGAIRGEVVDAHGAPLAGLGVSLSGSGYWDRRESDADGRFSAHGVPAGVIRVQASSPDGLSLEERITVTAGQTVEVRLAPPERLVRLHGSVRAAGAPLAEARVMAVQSEQGDARRTSQVETDGEGAFELVLPGPGAYRVHVNRFGSSRLSWNTPLEVPETESFACELAIPLGRISGRVTDPSGAPLGAIEVASEPERHEHQAFGSARTATDAEGRYELLVPPGRHAVVAGAGRTQLPSANGTRFTAARVTGLVLSADAELRGVDLVLSPGGTLTGIVRLVGGTPAARASIWHEDGGRLRRLAHADDAGRFEASGLAAGPHTLHVTAAAAATRIPLRAEVVAEETRHLEIELAAAVPVGLRVLQAGQPVGSEVTLLDDGGRQLPLETRAAGEVELGPLVPGRYTVRAQRDGRTIERAFDVTEGTPGLTLELAFD